MRLIADNLACERGGRRLFAGLSFAVEAGQALLLTGPNGSGKTTLIRALAHFIRPNAGTVRLEGGLPDTPLGEQCHYIGHLNGNKASLTVAENLGFWHRYLGAADSDGTAAQSRDLAKEQNPALAQNPALSLDQALDFMQLRELADIPAGYLSAGQRRRLGLARILVAYRPVWLLDEPTVSLDTASTKLVAAMVEAQIAAGGIVIAATHLPLGLTDARYLDLGDMAARIADAAHKADDFAATESDFFG